MLSLRGDVKQDKGLWSLIGGHLEEGESPIQCMIRESKEEIGIDIEKENLIPVSTMYGRKPEWFGKIKNIEGSKYQELKFFDMDHLPESEIGC